MGSLVPVTIFSELRAASSHLSPCPSRHLLRWDAWHPGVRGAMGPGVLYFQSTRQVRRDSRHLLGERKENFKNNLPWAGLGVVCPPGATPGPSREEAGRWASLSGEQAEGLRLLSGSQEIAALLSAGRRAWPCFPPARGSCFLSYFGRPAGDCRPGNSGGNGPGLGLPAASRAGPSPPPSLCRMAFQGSRVKGGIF